MVLTFSKTAKVAKGKAVKAAGIKKVMPVKKPSTDNTADAATGTVAIPNYRLK